MKIGFLSLPLSGHMNPMTALARKLQSRGNEVVFIGVPDSEATVRAADLDFVPFCEKEYPPGSVEKSWGEIARMQGIEVIRYSIRELTPGLVKAALEHLEEKIVKNGIEALVIDTAYRYLELVPMRLKMPYAQVWNILPYETSGKTPICLFNWPHENTPEALARNLEGVRMLGEFGQYALAHAKTYAAKHRFPIDWNDRAATASKFAIVSQTPEEFDYPGISWPPQFHYTGPFHDDHGRKPVLFPWEKLTDKPLIYASLGTLVNGLEDVYRKILDTVEALPDVQLVLSIGKHINPADLGRIPSNAIVVSSAPQIELLKRASLCITHAGLNTALEALAQGVPMVAIPIGFDQPGVAGRIAYHGAGEFVDIGELTGERLSELVKTVLGNPSYREKARYFQKAIAETKGLELAAEIIERAFTKNQVAELTGTGAGV